MSLLFVAALVATAISYYGEAVRCDDACVSADRASSWTETSAAWQWDAQLLLAVAGLIAMGLAIWRTARRRYGQTLLWIALGVAAYAGCFAINVSG